MLKYTKEDHRKWVDAIINDRVKELNEWEEGFIDSMDTRLAEGRPLTEPMEEKLETIYVRVT